MIGPTGETYLGDDLTLDTHRKDTDSYCATCNCGDGVSVGFEVVEITVVVACGYKKSILH